MMAVLVMTKIDINLSSEYGIMFLYDSKIRPTFPAEAGKNPVSHTPTCLAFSVLTYVDGDARIILCNKPGEIVYEEYFNGQIECVSKSVSLFDSSGIAYASVPIKDRYAHISLRMSEERNPNVVECIIDNIEMF